MKKNIENLAEDIMRLEKDYQLGKNASETLERVTQIASSLTLEEMIEIDNYIMEKLCNTKK